MVKVAEKCGRGGAESIPLPDRVNTSLRRRLPTPPIAAPRRARGRRAAGRGPILRLAKHGIVFFESLVAKTRIKGAR
jgi:hypothetical protein